jgi:3-oxoacyl-[acyl-carrier-protein] synthase III
VFGSRCSGYARRQNCDWMINLIDYYERFGILPGETFLAQASARGFYGYAVLEGSPRS